MNAVLLQPLEVSDPQNLYQLRIGSWTSGKALTTSYPAFGDIQQRNTTFSDIAGFNGFCQARLRWGDAVRNVSGYAVTGNYFDLLGVQPHVGRLIHAEDEHGPNSAPYIVLSDSLWRSAFNADPGVVGTTVRLYNDPFTVIGVAPARFHGTERFDLARLLHTDRELFRRGSSFRPDRLAADGAWPVEAGRDAAAGNGKPECDCGPQLFSLSSKR